MKKVGDGLNQLSKGKSKKAQTKFNFIGKSKMNLYIINWND